MHPHNIMTDGLAFPEGPVVMDDGSVIVVEIAIGRITRVLADGRRQTVAETGGGPNGLALGPDGALYVCNNGGFSWTQLEGMMIPGAAATDYTGGRIERVDVRTGQVERLYDSCDGVLLSGPNDIVFDDDGGFWFTDLGKHHALHTDHGGLFYGRADGSGIVCAVRGPNVNGVGLSPDGRTVYVATTYERTILAFEVTGPGTVTPSALAATPGRVVTSFPGHVLLDSLAIEADGRIAQATLVARPGICSVHPHTGEQEDFTFPDLLPTNIAFGGADMMDAYVTLSTTGKLAKCRWPRPGLRLNYQG